MSDCRELCIFFWSRDVPTCSPLCFCPPKYLVLPQWCPCTSVRSRTKAKVQPRDPGGIGCGQTISACSHTGTTQKQKENTVAASNQRADKEEIKKRRSNKSPLSQNQRILKGVRNYQSRAWFLILKLFQVQVSEQQLESSKRIGIQQKGS